MSVSFQRLIIILLSIIFLSFAIFLILFNSKKNIIFFFTPTELLSNNLKTGIDVRIGGFVKKGSLKKNIENNVFNFIISDNENEINVEYVGILPDLFKENNGAVVEGKLQKKNYLLATKVFAKHDENYMPSSIKKQLEEKDYWEKEY